MVQERIWIVDPKLMAARECLEVIVDDYREIGRITRETASYWRQARGIAPDDVADILDSVRFDWLVELTDALDMWISRGSSMTEGELILARINIGMIVEFWLRLFYSVYIEDYNKQPIMGVRWDKRIRQKVKRPLSPTDEASFSQLEDKSAKDILWQDANDAMCQWVDKVRVSRNAAHPFLTHNIGTNADFLGDIGTLRKFINEIELRLPPIEDVIAEILEYL